jgi:aspartate aminotransferase-like enzyme
MVPPDDTDDLATVMAQLRRTHALAQKNGEFGSRWWKWCARLIAQHLRIQRQYVRHRHLKTLRQHAWLRRQLNGLFDKRDSA